MTWVSSFPHLQSIFQWKKLPGLITSLPLEIFCCHAFPRDTGVLFCPNPGVGTLACTWHTNSVPYTGYQPCVVSRPSQRNTRTKVLPRQRDQGKAQGSEEKKGAPHRPGSSTEPSTSLLMSLIIVQTPRQECEKVKTSPTSKEKEMAQKNLSAFKGLGDQQNLHGTVCRMANVEIEFQLVSGVKVHMCMNELTVCHSSDHNLHCHHHVRQLQSILMKMEILSASFLLTTHTHSYFPSLVLSFHKV